jgi:hypothetical protein
MPTTPKYNSFQVTWEVGKEDFVLEYFAYLAAITPYSIARVEQSVDLLEELKEKRLFFSVILPESRLQHRAYPSRCLAAGGISWMLAVQ